MGVEDDAAETVYRWTIRSLYVLAIGLNVYMLWEQMKDTPEMGEYRARLDLAKQRALAPLRERKRMKLETGKVIFEAMEIVADA
jgi:hypothetical protein